MGVPIEEATKALNADNSPGNRSPVTCGELEQFLDGLIRGPGERGEPAPESAEIGAEPPGNREDDMPVRDRLQDLAGDELAEFDLALLVARGTQAPSLARELSDAGLVAKPVPLAQLASPHGCWPVTKGPTMCRTLPGRCKIRLTRRQNEVYKRLP